MNEIRQHIPAFVEHDEEDVEKTPFETADDLIAIPWVKKWREFPGFYRFSLSGAGSYHHLMAEFRDGREWWVVGILKAAVEGLPAWNHGIYEVEIDGKPVDIPGAEVSSSCGDEVRLKDGRTVKRRNR